ncbi:S8 family serine peptidase [Aliiroseovarius sp. F47248L]|uniref:S8 family serine peptidase n=1 Tax=Aliiroseovarius sp. F47248L TaxID=2926420 RepID=UPI001FF5E3FA|nr:S8 family serine peptidase [Aliiroseovarius sp. F47248L]MCK0140562.1 S8 family serine peptidase [Aliiroseovarius sp. F47248L]
MNTANSKCVQAEHVDESNYYYLWHLVSLGVLTPDDTQTGFSDTLWDTLAAKAEAMPSTVVLIDVGCSFAHPNLKDRVDPSRSLDFTGTPYGARLATDKDEERKNFAGLSIDGLHLDGLEADERAMFDEVVQHLAESTGELRAHGDTEAKFASHGTAVSGLIVGGPENCCGKDHEPSKGVIPYFGVDPFSHLISLRTGFDNDPLQFIAALLYAWHQKPDVIVMPRGLPDPEASIVTPKDDFKAELQSWANREAADLLHRIAMLAEKASPHDPTAPQVSETGRHLWRVVRALFIAISKHVPIVCAAGNEGESQLLFPANLANRENGVIAVGAVSGQGYRSGYSNYGDGLTLVAPSDDMEVFNRHQLRETPKQLDKIGYLKPDSAMAVPYSRKGLLSTDIPGSFGYDGAGDDDHDLPADVAQSGFYTQFGGTSGASALVGGVIALVRRAERLSASGKHPRDGCDLKAFLMSTARRDMPMMGATLSLKSDCMNVANEDADAFGTFFGAGLIDAKAAVTAALE